MAGKPQNVIENISKERLCDANKQSPRILYPKTAEELFEPQQASAFKQMNTFEDDEWFEAFFDQ